MTDNLEIMATEMFASELDDTHWPAIRDAARHSIAAHFRDAAIRAIVKALADGQPVIAEMPAPSGAGEQAFFDWWDKPGRPTILNHRIAFEAGYRAASVDTHRMAETAKTGSGRSLSGAVPPQAGDAQ